MYSHRISRLLASISGLLASTIALAQDTSISYQGYVTNNGGIIQGPTDFPMTFRLYDSAGVLQPGGTIGPISVSVEQSLFSVPLAFPTSLWTGADRYLEVQIGGETLTPRQKIHWVPYAAHALTAGSVTGGVVSGSGTANRVPKFTAATVLGNSTISESSGNVGIGTTSPATLLHLARIGAFSLRMQDIDASDPAAPTYQMAIGSDNTLRLGDVSAGDTIYFYPTTRNMSIGSNVEAGRLMVEQTVTGTNTAFRVRLNDGGPVTRFLISDNGATSIGANTIGPQNGLRVAGDSWLVGNVGIGTTTPGFPLSFPNTIGDKVAFYGQSGDHYGIGIQGSLLQIHSSTATSDIAFGYGSSATMTETMRIRGNGNVGIGTSTPAAKLHVAGDLRSQSLSVSSNLGLLHANLDFVPGTGVPSIGSNLSLFNGTTETVTLSAGAPSANGLFNSGSLLNLRNSYGTSVAAIGGGGNTVPVENSAGFFQLFDGAGTLEMQLSANSEFGAGEIRMFGPNGTTETIEIVAADGAGQGGGISVRRANGAEGIYLNGDESGGGAALYVYNGTDSAPTIRLDGDYQGTGVGRVITDVLEITGADLAEKFPTSEDIAPGMVVAIDEVNEGKLCLARGAYSRTVAGVVSGANNFSVGAILGSRTESADGPPIALAGRVYVWCDADAAPIKPGDLLTTSDIPGHAMKVLDHDAAQGAILGKAMGSLDKGSGLLLVLVNLQ